MHLELLEGDTWAFDRLQGLDIFGGAGNMSQAMIDEGLASVKFDLADDEKEDALTEEVRDRISEWRWGNRRGMKIQRSCPLLA